jgi:acyl carrier protein
MGLDGVELIMRCEKAFGIELKDEALVAMRTPRELVDLIFSKLKTTEEPVCRSQHAFHVIREALVDAVGLDRERVTPDMQFRGWISKSQEREVWEQMKAAIGPRIWPELARPLWVSLSLLAMELVLLGMTIFIGIRSMEFTYTIACGVVVMVLFLIAASVATHPLKTRIAWRFKSIRDLIPYAVTSDHALKWSRADVSLVVKQLVIEILGLDESDYTEDSRFVEDLHMD